MEGIFFAKEAEGREGQRTPLALSLSRAFGGRHTGLAFDNDETVGLEGQVDEVVAVFVRSDDEFVGSSDVADRGGREGFVRVVRVGTAAAAEATGAARHTELSECGEVGETSRTLKQISLSEVSTMSSTPMQAIVKSVLSADTVSPSPPARDLSLSRVMWLTRLPSRSSSCAARLCTRMYSLKKR